MNKKSCSVADLRKSFITWKFKDSVGLRERIKVAKTMLHGTDVQQYYYEKKS